MGKHGWAITALIIICFSLLSSAALTRSSQYALYQQDLEYNRQECASQTDAEHAEHRKECQSFLYRALEDPVATLTGFLAVATVALFVATFGLYAAAVAQGADAKEAVAVARETSKTQLRAYISVFDAVFRPDNGNIKLSVKVKNFGQTPAYRVQTCIQLAYGPADADSYDELDNFGSTSILGPTAEIELSGLMPLDKDQLTRLIGQQSRIFVSGIVVYRDAFGDERFFKFKARSGAPEMVTLQDGRAALTNFPVIPAVNGYQAN